jgi:hypothetical protein
MNRTRYQAESQDRGPDQIHDLVLYVTIVS